MALDFDTTAASAASARGHVAWACDVVEDYIGGTVAANVALKHVQAGYDDFLRGIDPRTNMRHEWSFLHTYQELTLTASAEGTATGVYTASAAGRQLGTIAVTATTAIFTSSHVGMYLAVEDVGTYRISAYGGTDVVTVQVLTGQTAANFTSKTIHLAGIYDLATDFGGLDGGVTYMHTDAYVTPKLELVSPERMHAMWRDDDNDGDPRYYAIAPKEFASATGQRWQLLVYPRPTNTRIVRIPYRVIHSALTDSTTEYFLGGDMHYETIKLAALADVEFMTGRAGGIMAQRYQEAKIQSIDADKSLFGSQGPISLSDADTGISRTD
jgi:hypothetical protein